MANPEHKWPENVPGKFFVDEACIGSQFCVSTAPNHFRMSEAGYAYVFRQPQTAEEEAQCREALAGCPVAAIGNHT